MKERNQKGESVEEATHQYTPRLLSNHGSKCITFFQLDLSSQRRKRSKNKTLNKQTKTKTKRHGRSVPLIRWHRALGRN